MRLRRSSVLNSNVYRYEYEFGAGVRTVKSSATSEPSLSKSSCIAAGAEVPPPRAPLPELVAGVAGTPSQKADAYEVAGGAAGSHLALTNGTGLPGALRHSRLYGSPGTRNARPRAATDAGPTATWE